MADKKRQMSEEKKLLIYQLWWNYLYIFCHDSWFENSLLSYLYNSFFNNRLTYIELIHSMVWVGLCGTVGIPLKTSIKHMIISKCYHQYLCRFLFNSHLLTLTYKQGPQKLKYTAQDTSLPQGQDFCPHWCPKGIGHIICSNGKGQNKGYDEANDYHPQVFLRYWHHCHLSTRKNKGKNVETKTFC